MFVFGGYTDTIVNELWRYSIQFNRWELLKKKSNERGPIAVYGHASVLIRSEIYSFFGFNKELLYCKYIQKYDLGRLNFHISNEDGGSMLMNV